MPANQSHMDNIQHAEVLTWPRTDGGGSMAEEVQRRLRVIDLASNSCVISDIRCTCQVRKYVL